MVAALVLLMFAAGCATTDEGPLVATAGGVPAGTGEPRPTGSGDTSDQLRRFAGCMRDNGVDLPDPQPGAGGQNMRAYAEMLRSDDPVVQAAFQECRGLLPNGGEPPKLDAEQLETYRNFAACMREQGVEIPDPKPDGTLDLGALLDSGLDPQSPAVLAAFAACRDTLTGIMPGAGQAGD
jgi:hypothetical protein